MTPAQVVILSEEQAHARRAAERRARRDGADGAVGEPERGSMRDLATLGGLG